MGWPHLSVDQTRGNDIRQRELRRHERAVWADALAHGGGGDRVRVDNHRFDILRCEILLLHQLQRGLSAAVRMPARRVRLEIDVHDGEAVAQFANNSIQNRLASGRDLGEAPTETRPFENVGGSSDTGSGQSCGRQTCACRLAPLQYLRGVTAH